MRLLIAAGIVILIIVIVGECGPGLLLRPTDSSRWCACEPTSYQPACFRTQFPSSSRNRIRRTATRKTDMNVSLPLFDHAGDLDQSLTPACDIWIPTSYSDWAHFASYTFHFFLRASFF